MDRYSGYRTYAAVVCSIPELKNKVWQLGGFSGANDGRFIKLGRDSEFIPLITAPVVEFDPLVQGVIEESIDRLPTMPRYITGAELSDRLKGLIRSLPDV